MSESIQPSPPDPTEPAQSPTSPLPISPPSSSPHAPADDHEEVYFDGTPSLRSHMSTVLLWGLIGLILIAAAVWTFIDMRFIWAGIALVVIGVAVFFVPVALVRSVRYRITNYRIDYERGVLGKRIDTLELWHVEDISFRQSLLDRIFNVGTITIVSHDETTPQLAMRGLPNPRPIYESLKQRVIAVKRQRGVIKMDVG